VIVRRGRTLHAGTLGLLVATALVPCADLQAATGAEAARAGAYCPLPTAGEVPACLTPAQARYGEFFDALEQGGLDADQTARVEADLTSRTDAAFLALSSLAYAYYQLARQLSERPDADPALTARLAHWNSLLLNLYGTTEADPELRQAVREAASNLQERSPAPPTGPSSADSLALALARMDAEAGLRGPLGHLLHRIWAEPADASRGAP